MIVLGNRYLERRKIEKGWSNDKKYRVVTAAGEVCLLRVSDAAQLDAKKKEYEIIQKFASLGFPMSQPLEFGLCEDGICMRLSWLEGDDLELVLPELPEAEQYRLGREAGTILKKIHALPLDPTDVPMATKREKKLRQLAAYERSAVRIPGDEGAVRYVKDHIDLIWRRIITALFVKIIITTGCWKNWITASFPACARRVPAFRVPCFPER